MKHLRLATTRFNSLRVLILIPKANFSLGLSFCGKANIVTDDDGLETEERKMKDFLNLHDAIESEKIKKKSGFQTAEQPRAECVFIGKLSALCMLMLVDTWLLGNR